MRKHHKRWIALAGATSISLAGFGALGGGVAATEEDPAGLAWPVIEQKASHYALDGFEITYLPPGLERHGIHAKSSIRKKGERSSFIAWTRGVDALYGKVGVVRKGSLKTLDDLRKDEYGHLRDDVLEKVDNNGREAYLSAKTGDLFWIEEPGVGVITYLRPSKWDRAELMKLGSAVKKQKLSGSRPTLEAPSGEQGAAPPGLGGAAEQSPESSASGQPQEPAGQASGAPELPEASGSPTTPKAPKLPKPSQGPAAEQPGGQGQATESKPGMPLPDAPDTIPPLPPGLTADKVLTCLVDEFLGPDQDERGTADRAAFADAWKGATESARTAAVAACAEQFQERRSDSDSDGDRLDSLIDAIWETLDWALEGTLIVETDDADFIVDHGDFDSDHFFMDDADHAPQTQTKVKKKKKRGLAAISTMPWTLPGMSISLGNQITVGEEE